MLSPAELAGLGYVDGLANSFKASESLTTVLCKFVVNDDVKSSPDKMSELKELIVDICQMKIKGLVDMQMGVDDKNEVCTVLNSAVYEGPKGLDNVFIQMFERFLKLSTLAVMTEMYCLTSEDEMEECREALERFSVPEKFVVVPSLISKQRAEKKKAAGGGDDESDEKIKKDKVQGADSVIRNMGKWTVKPAVVENDAAWQALVNAMYKYNEVMLDMKDVLFVENALSREQGEFYFSEQYANQAAVMKRAEYLKANADKLGVAMDPEEMYIFCSKDNIPFSTKILTVYNANIWHVLDHVKQKS